MTNLDPPMPSIAQRVTAIKNLMQEISLLREKLNVNHALYHRNRPDKTILHYLTLKSDVILWREGNFNKMGMWSGLFKLIQMNGENCKINLLSDPTNFRSNLLRPYWKAKEDIEREYIELEDIEWLDIEQEDTQQSEN